MQDDLRAVFQPYGEIVNIDVKRDKITHNNLGYGFAVSSGFVLIVLQVLWNSELELKRPMP